MTQDHTNFLGIPVKGEIYSGGGFTAQRPLEELEPLLRAVLDDPMIVSFGWRQYTPYFNDGDPCTFSAQEPWFRTQQDVAEADAEIEKVREVIPFLLDKAGSCFSEHKVSILKDLLSAIETSLSGEDDSDDDEETYTLSYHPVLSTTCWGSQGRETIPRSPEIMETIKRCSALSAAIQGGEFDHVLINAFGDHCSIKMTRDGITIDEYSHD